MLFDLKSGKRRRVIQIVFGFLAFIFFISFVGFGIGSDVSGGIFDAIGLGGGDSSQSSQYEEQIEDAETTLETDPENERALTDLVRYHFLSATESGVSTDPATGTTSITEESRAQLEQAAAAWDDYIATKPRNPDVGVAANAAQAFVLLADADGAAAAQRVVAEGQDTAAAYGQLAFYLYADGKIAAGDAAGDQAVAAADPSQRSAIRRNMDALAEQARKQKKQLAQQAEQAQGGGGEDGSPQIQDPFGGLSGAGGTTAPAP
jgi:hypothetical protein